MVKGIAALIVGVTCVCCSGQPVGPTPAPPVPLPPGPDPVPIPSPSGPRLFSGAGDIAMCDRNSQDTARLLDGIGGTLFTLGDNAYFQGSRQNYLECYEPTWGRHKNRTFPVPGNHDYEAPGAAPYFEYFGVNAGPPGLGYYSHQVGAWHAIALNSNVPMGPGSAQGAWLQNDLASSRARCTVAYWHHPLFTSGPNRSNPAVRDLWRVLYEAGVEIVLNGHDHLYERFAPQDPDGRADPVRGIRQFIAGTGGAFVYQVASVQPNSEVRIAAFGVLKLTLSDDAYDWEFIPVSGPSDAGTGRCH